jgi:hypothetical protein
MAPAVRQGLIPRSSSEAVARKGACKWGRHCCRPHSHRLRSPAFRPVGFPEGSIQSCVARRSRRHPVPSGGLVRCKHLSFLPGGSAVDQSVGALRVTRSGSGLAAFPFPSTPSRTDRPPGNVPLRLFHRPHSDPKIVAPALFPSRVAFATASKLSFLSASIPARRLSWSWSGFPASMTGKCAQPMSRSSRGKGYFSTFGDFGCG